MSGNNLVYQRDINSRGEPMAQRSQNGAAFVSVVDPITGMPSIGATTTSAGVDRSVTASTTSSQLMAANTARRGLFIANDTAIDVWINFGATAVATAGGGNIKIGANGGRYESGAFTPSTAINIIATSGTPAITAREFIAVAVAVADAPVIGTATAGRESASLTFTPGASNGGYTVQDYLVSAYDSLTNVRFNTFTATASPVTMSPIPAGISAYFKVQARTANGFSTQSGASNAVNILAPFAAPGAPQNVVATLNGTTVTSTYTAPAINGGSAIDVYRSTLYRASDNVQIDSVIGTGALAHTNVPAGTALYTKVDAHNVPAGYGFASPSNVVQTASAPAIPVINALNSASVFGDSLMQYGNPLVTGSAPASGGETSMSHVGWANDTLRLTGAGIDPIALRAVGGTTAQQHLSTQLPAVISDASAGAWYHGGVNSFNDAISTPLGGPYTLEQNITAVTSIINQLAAAKQWVIIDTINPVSQAGATGAKARAGEFPAYNAAIKAVCDALPNVIFNDEYAVIVDPGSGVFNPLPNLIQAVDGIHDTTQGARVRGENVVPKIAARLALTKYRTQGANLLPVFTGTGGTATPGTGTINGIAALPADWNCTIASGSPTVTLSNPTAGTVRLTVSNPGGTASTVQLLALNNAALLAAIGNGDVVQGGTDFATVGTSTNLTRVAASIRINGAAGILWNAMARDATNEASGVFKYNQAASSGRRWTHPWTVPSAPSQVEFILAINLDPAGSAVVDFSLPTLFKLAP